MGVLKTFNGLARASVKTHNGLALASVKSWNGMDAVEGGGAFDPLSLSPALWLDASDASTLYDSTSGGSLVTSDATVGRWEDKSGNSRHVIQSNGAYRPIRKTAIQNGLDIVRFDGGDDHMVFADGLGTRSGITVIAAFKLTSLILDHVFIASEWNSGAFPGTNEWNLGMYGPDGGLSQGKPNFGVEIGTNVYICNESSTRIAEALVVSASHDGADMRLYTNGTATATATATGTMNQASGRQFYLGTLHVNGSPQALGFKGDIMELFVFPSVLSTTNRENVESLLNTKWASY